MQSVVYSSAKCNYIFKIISQKAFL